MYPTTDDSTVTVAEPGRALEFVAENRYCRRCTGRYRNRYDLEPTPDGGTLVSYTFQRLASTGPRRTCVA